MPHGNMDADKALEALPEDLLKMLVARHRTGMSYAELSSHFGVSKAVVAERLCRARKMFREKICS